jgi:phage-related protein (TIGR01555 family)
MHRDHGREKAISLNRTGLPRKQGGNGQYRKDGWTNAVTYLGDKNKDKRRRTSPKQFGRLPFDKLEALYRDHGIARRIIDLPADSMTREWFTLTEDKDDKVMQRLETLGAQDKITEAIKQARLYGGSLVLMGVDDGQFRTDDDDPDLTLPVKEDSIKSVNFLQVFAGVREVEVLTSSIDKSVTSDTCGEPLLYRINKILGGGSFDVHASRVIRFDGALVPRITKIENAGWHDSVFQAAYTQIRQVGTTYDSAEFIIQDFVTTIVKIQDLLNLIASGQEDLLKKRINYLDLSRHVANTVLLSSEEEFDRKSSTVAGLGDLLDRFMMALSSVTGIPVTLLMGRSPAGMNATGESDIRLWYDKVRSDQNNMLKPRLEKLIRYLFLEDGGKEPEEWSITFNPLFQLTEKEKSELYKSTAEADAVYINANVLDPVEVAVSRFGGEEFNTGNIEIVDREKPEAPEDEPDPIPPVPPLPPGQPGAAPATVPDPIADPAKEGGSQ